MKTKNQLLRLVVFIFAYLNFSALFAQTTINSLTELKTYITQNNVNAVMTPGTYYIDSSITGTGNLLPDPIMFEFTGSNSTYDFSGVKFEFNTEILNDYGNVEVVEIRLYGDNNVLKNLTMEDIGTDAPRNRARAIHLDGLNNRIEGFHITVRGSYPYGYGDLFGKGGSSVIGHRKHSGILVRGDGNHIKDCTMIHRSYGHGIFIQGGKNVLIEGVYMEGDELRKTDDVLAEAGTGSAADNVNFMSVWGYTVPAGYMFSKQEDGIRAYASAGLYSNDKTGATTTSSTENVTIKDCTVKRMRGSYSLAFGTGDYLVENCSSIESERGFSMKSDGVISNCSSDAKYGMVYGNAYNSDNNITADITVLNSDGGYGPHHLAYVGGSNNNITFKSAEGYVSQARSIKLAGEKNDMRMFNGSNASQTRHNSSSNTIVNESDYPVLLDSGSTTIDGTTYTWDASNNSVQSCGTVTDNGSSNTISSATCSVVLSNVALNGTATQSSTNHGGVASRAIDGDTNGAWSGNSVTHTASETNPTWEVDLGSNFNIDNIVVWGRSDSCCKTRLSNFTVSVLDYSGTSSSFSQTFTSTPDPSVTANVGGATGQIVRIQLNGTNALSLAEVQVFGETSYMPVAGKTYYIDSPRWNLRLGANGGEDAYTTSTSTIGSNVEWTFTESTTAGYFWIDNNGGGSKPRIRTDRTDYADMQATSSAGSWTKWEITPSSVFGQFLLTTQDQTMPRLQIDDVGDVRMTAASASGSWTQFTFTEVVNPSASSKGSTKTVNLQDSEEEIEIFPNPFENFITVSGSKGSLLVVYNTNGKEVYVKKISSDSERIDLTTISTGFYYAKVIGEKSESVIKLIKK